MVKTKKLTKTQTKRLEMIRRTYIRLYQEEGVTGDLARLRLALIELVGEPEQARLVGLWNEEAEKEKAKTPRTLYAIVCESGKPYADGGGLAISEDRVWVEEYLEQLAHSGWMCKCKDHRVVPYVPAAPTKVRSK